MPSRFCFYGDPEEVVKRFPISNIEIDYYNNYNIKPTNRVVGIIYNTENGKNELVRLRWGFVKGNQFFKARGESVHEKRLFAKAFKERRCLLLLNGFFEWKKESGTSIPFYFKMKNNDMFAIAGLYNKYIDEEDEGKTKYRFAVLTTEANDLVAEIFHRMPVILEKQEEDKWLNPTTTDTELHLMIGPYNSSLMEYFQVNELPARKDNGPATIDPISSTSLDDFF